MTSFRPSRLRSAMATWAICGRSSPFGGVPMGRAVKSAVACVDDAAVPDAVVPAGAGSPPPHAIRPTDVAAIVRNNRTKDQGPKKDQGTKASQGKKTKDKETKR